jgi:hypothetical protein
VFWEAILFEIAGWDNPSFEDRTSMAKPVRLWIIGRRFEGGGGTLLSRFCVYSNFHSLTTLIITFDPKKEIVRTQRKILSPLPIILVRSHY